MLKSKMISISDEHLSKTSQASYFKNCIEQENHLNKNVAIITLGESLYSKYIISSIQLENHFRDFYALSGYIGDQEIETYQSIRNTMVSLETCVIIGDDSRHNDYLAKLTASGKTSHRVVNVSHKANNHTDHHIYNIGYTRHNTPKDVLNNLDTNISLPLGAAKQDITLVEPLVRDTRVAVIDLGIISNTSVGFSIFEICSIVRYLGYSNTLDTLYLYHDHMEDLGYPMEQAALLTWYFLEGRHHRQEDYPTNPSNKIYLVHSTIMDLDLEFYKSNLTGRWWIQHPENKTNFIPVSYTEYNEAINNNLSNRLLEFIT